MRVEMHPGVQTIHLCNFWQLELLLKVNDGWVLFIQLIQSLRCQLAAVAYPCHDALQLSYGTNTRCFSCPWKAELFRMFLLRSPVKMYLNDLEPMTC